MKTDHKRAALRAVFGASLLTLAVASAFAQTNTDTYFYTPNGGGVNGAVGMCLNSSNKAVPCSASGVTPSPSIAVPYSFTPAGTMQSQLAVTTPAVVSLSPPAGALLAVVCIRSGGSAINFSDDGTTTPTTTVTGNGRQLAAGSCVSIQGNTLINNFKAIAETATTAIDVEYDK